MTTPPRQRLAEAPERFELDQAIDLVAPGGDPRAVTYRSTARLSHAEAAVVAADPDSGALTLGGFGLVGPGGVLPRHHTAQVAAEKRKRSEALHAFLDLLGGRFAGLWAAAGRKYRPTRDAVPAEQLLAAAIGLGTPHLAERAGLEPAALLYHAGHLAARSRSAERLRALLQEEAGHPVALEEFAGGWLRLPEGERSRLGAAGAHNALGVSTALGAQVWDAQSRFVIRIGPLPREAFEALLPGRPLHQRLVALARLHVGLDIGFAINPVLAAEAVPQAALGGGARLGWSSWMGGGPARRQDAAEAVFEAKAG
ncbi:type VI secretion system baseplate subunit TssG [Teichococcus cervicalis]|uniref:type VI secretion system baseplate subunit TssG n=1 Tax=Teichococcus cervicalis TaxID=204525 RepID=UPI0002DC1CD6|nr:type VI secretion system baseplate subunit TssG [Pseudoroseomonas cervicalis]